MDRIIFTSMVATVVVIAAVGWMYLIPNSHIEQNLQPCVSVLICISYSPDIDSQYVLETVAGFTQRRNISVGTDIDFELVR